MKTTQTEIIKPRPGASLLGDANIAPRPEFTAGPDGVYTEIHITRDNFRPVVFPDKCPACGAPATNSSGGQTEWAIVEYACLGRYEPKPQIQSHTAKWWGNCRKHIAG